MTRSPPHPRRVDRERRRVGAEGQRRRILDPRPRRVHDRRKAGQRPVRRRRLRGDGSWKLARHRSTSTWATTSPRLNATVNGVAGRRDSITVFPATSTRDRQRELHLSGRPPRSWRPG
jgi:hypothetical protein